MIRDCPGLESDERVESESAVPGEGLRGGDGAGSASGSGDRVVVDVIGNDDSRRRSPVRAGTLPGLGDAVPPVKSRSTVVFVEGVREITGLIEVFKGVPAPLPASFRSMGESFRIERDEGAR